MAKGSYPVFGQKRRRSGRIKKNTRASTPAVASPPAKKKRENGTSLAHSPPAELVAAQPTLSRGGSSTSSESLSQQPAVADVAAAVQASSSSSAMHDVAGPSNRRAPDYGDVKSEPHSREASVAPAVPINALKRVKTEPNSGASSSSVHAVLAAVNGVLKGRPLENWKRDVLEKNSYLMYSYPRHNGFTPATKSRKDAPRGRLLDLMYDEDLSDGEAESDKTYDIGSVMSMDKSSALVYWFGYKYPTWHTRGVVRSGPALTEYNRRTKIREGLLTFMYTNESWAFIKNLYPNVHLQQTNDYCEYVKHPGIVYLVGLRKREGQINDFVDTHYGRNTDKDGPIIVFEDWTSFERSSIPQFEYLIDSELRQNVAALEKTFVAKSKGCQCAKGCFQERQCCSHKSKARMAYLHKGKIGNTVHLKKSDEEGVYEKASDFVDLYECGDACACTGDKDRCIQRMLQNGSDIKLVVFRHYEKGWTLRAGCNMASGAFVIAYTGEMMTAKEALSRGDTTYQVEMNVKLTTGMVRELVIDAKNKGNVARFIAHSCDPNLFTMRVHFDIEGRPKRHLGMYASRCISIGEELTFNYYSTTTDPEEFHRLTEKAGFVCKCGSANCMERAYQASRPKESRKSLKMVKCEPIDID